MQLKHRLPLRYGGVVIPQGARVASAYFMRDDRCHTIPPLTWAEIDLSAIEHNLKEIQYLAARNRFLLSTRPQRAGKNSIAVLAVIKADAYGHGMKEIGRLLERNGVNFLAVSDVAEGIYLRKAGIKSSILLLENTLPSFVPEIWKFHLTPTVCTIELAKTLNRYAHKKRRNIPIHVKVDTGMGRLGVWHREALEFIEHLERFSSLTMEGLYTHFPSADCDRPFTLKQIEHLSNLVKCLDQKGLVIPYIHAANSMGLAKYKTQVLNLVRPGLMIYGLYPQTALRNKIHLKPAMSVYSRIIFLKTIERGRGISYGRTFIAKKDMVVATIPIGYSDGYLRGFSHKAAVLIGGKRCPVIGRVTMDQIVADVSSVKNVFLGMPVVILGRQGKEVISADELARHAGTINYEIVCQLGNRLKRVCLPS